MVKALSYNKMGGKMKTRKKTKEEINQLNKAFRHSQKLIGELTEILDMMTDEEIKEFVEGYLLGSFCKQLLRIVRVWALDSS